MNKLGHWKWVLILLFFITRLYIWIDKPTDFTEITYSYMPYAHLWASGVRPYLDQWYEYPPATIPIFYIPHIIDMMTLGSQFHIDYGNAYRGSMLLFDVGIFFMLWKWLSKTRVKSSVVAAAVIYYSLITAKAHHFIYDTMDISFAFALLLSVVAPVIFTQKKAIGQYMSWLGYWLAVALKYINGPLGLVQFALTARKNLITTVVIMGLAAVSIWAIPLLLYRSSIQVSLVYHQIRGLQIDSTAAMIPRTVTLFTDEESVVEVYKNYEIDGPTSAAVLKSLDVLFPLSIVVYIGWATWLVWRQKKSATIAEQQQLLLWLTLGYILVFMLFGKVLSRPFLLWHIPLIAALPYTNLKQALSFMITSFIMIVSLMTLFPRVDQGWFMSQGLILGWIRVFCAIILFWLWERQMQHRYLTNKQSSIKYAFKRIFARISP